MGMYIQKLKYFLSIERTCSNNLTGKKLRSIKVLITYILMPLNTLMVQFTTP